MKIAFSKMQALGNDFVVIEGLRQAIQLSTDQIRALADRHRGIGFDQLLLLEPPSDGAADFRYRIFNADGSEVAQCGNGARCLACFIQENALSSKPEVKVETLAGLLRLRCLGPREASVSLGVPRFEASAIPHHLEGEKPPYRLVLGDQVLELYAVNVGNPHVVMRVDQIEQADVAGIGQQLTRHPAFPEGVNVGFVTVDSPRHLSLRVYERGAGETQACGSGACAAAVIAVSQGWSELEVTVSQQGGDVQVLWEEPSKEVWLSGEAASVFRGELEI